MATQKENLIAVAVAFGISTEGLTVPQLQDALAANIGYQQYMAADVAAQMAETRVKELESNLSVVNRKNTELQNALATANADKDAFQAKVNELEGDLTAANGQLGEVNTVLEASESKVAELLKEVQELKELSAANTPEVVEEEVNEPLPIFEYEGRKYTLVDKAPKKISFNDRIYSKVELLNDTDAMTSLIVGGNAFVKQVF